MLQNLTMALTRALHRLGCSSCRSLHYAATNPWPQNRLILNPRETRREALRMRQQQSWERQQLPPVPPPLSRLLVLPPRPDLRSRPAAPRLMSLPSSVDQSSPGPVSGRSA